VSWADEVRELRRGALRVQVRDAACRSSDESLEVQAAGMEILADALGKYGHLDDPDFDGALDARDVLRDELGRRGKEGE
jgi:hypothetical protein